MAYSNGEWQVVKDEIYILHNGELIKPICQVYMPFAVTPEDLGNLQLISAAPNMFEALKYIQLLTSVPLALIDFEKFKHAIDMVNTALIKADGPLSNEEVIK